MLLAFVNEAALELEAGGDDRAPGAAVTMELCGHWEHEGSCRWPHHTGVEERSGQTVTVRTVFAVEACEEDAVRGLLVHALRAGRLERPGGLSRWRVVAEAVAELRTAERPLAQRLTDP